jgi:putative transcriptional regulator
MVDFNQRKSSAPARPGIPRVQCPAPRSIDVRSIRLNLHARGGGSLGATQQTFADAIGVPVKTLRNWEQRRREPTGPARVLLMMIERNPWIVLDALNEMPPAA